MEHVQQNLNRSRKSPIDSNQSAALTIEDANVNKSAENRGGLRSWLYRILRINHSYRSMVPEATSGAVKPECIKLSARTAETYQHSHRHQPAEAEQPHGSHQGMLAHSSDIKEPETSELMEECHKGPDLSLMVGQLVSACRLGDVKSVEEILKEYPGLILTQFENPDVAGPWINLMHIAALEHKYAMIEYLLHKTSGKETSSFLNGSGMSLAAEMGDVFLARLLVQHGDYVNWANNRGITALHVAAANGHLEIVKILVKANADVHMKARNIGETPLHMASRNGHVTIAEILIEQGGAEIETTTIKGGFTPLHLASNFGHSDMVQYLIGKNANTLVQSTSGKVAANYALEQGHKELGVIIVQAGKKKGKSKKKTPAVSPREEDG